VSRPLVVVVVVAVAVATILTSACGVGGNGDLQQIGTDDLVGLDQTTTSTTTTTSTVAPTATMQQGTTTTIGVTTSTVDTEPVELYFVAGGALESVSQPLTRGVSLFRVLTALESGPPPPEVGIGLTSDVPIGLTRIVTESGTGVATVDLVADVFEDIPGGVEQRRAIAQIVLTMTMRPGIGQVRFTLDGEPLQVPKLDNVLSDPGEPVARIDYESLLDQSEVPPSTLVPTVTTASPTSSLLTTPDETGPSTTADG
jgi:spore germination protein GerM